MRHDKPRLLIIGACGFLGQRLARKAAFQFEVFEADLVTAPEDSVIPVDITSTASVNAAFQIAAPDAVALLAAVSDIDQCESLPEMAEAVNVYGTSRVVQACFRTGAKLLFTSSAAVFDGSRHGYVEEDPRTPVSVYGRTKARAEELILSKLPSALILRLALVVGYAEGSGTNAMLNKLTEKLSTGQPVLFPDYEYRNPIDAATLSDFMLELLQRPETGGLFHVGATESISRFELGVRLARELGFSTNLIERQTTPLQGRAPRGLDHFLLTHKVQSTCQTPVPSCNAVIERAIHGSPQGN